MSPDERWFQGQLTELTRAECLEQVSTRPVGRIAWCDEDGPVVLPVTYGLDGEDVLFRTSPDSNFARHLGSAPVAFEVDEIDEYTQSGWSVLIRGQASFTEQPGLTDDTAERPVPWALGHHTLLVRITPRTMTGRRLLAG
jgi:uncharacterized protein